MKRTLAKGIIALSFSQVVILFAGLIIHAFMGRHFGAELYGLYGVILSILVWLEAPLGIAIRRTVSSLVSTRQGSVYSIFTGALKIQMALAFIICLIAFIFSGFISMLLGDSRLVVFFRIAILDIPIFALYSIYLGVLNGLRRFLSQSLAHIAYSLTKPLAIIVLVSIGLSLKGALFGHILASLAGLFVAISIIKLPKDQGIVEPKEIFGLSISMIILTLIGALLGNLDLVLVKALIREASYTGYYTAASTLAKIPMFAFIGLSAALFPSVSASISRGDVALNREYILKSSRFLFLCLVPIIALIISSSKELISLIYTQDFLPSAPVLSILVLGFSFFTFMSLCNIILLADKKVKQLILLFSALAVLYIVLNLLLIPKMKIIGAAIGTTCVAALGFIASAFFVHKRFKVFINGSSVFRILFAGGFICIISILLKYSGFLLIIKYGILFLLYFGLLCWMREITKQDFETFKDLLQFRAQ